MQKNVSSQKLIVFAFDSTTNLPKTGDSANITAYVSIDYGSVTVLGDTSATEMDATNAKGYYLFDLTQGETNGNTLLFSAKSSTANIVVVGAPAVVQTVPAAFVLVAGAAGGLFIAGTNAATTITTSLTTTFTGNLTGSVASVTGAVGSVTGAVGSVTGAVGSVTGAVGSVTGNVGGNVTGSVGSVTGLTASDVGAIKTQTDKFVFTVANQVDCNVITKTGFALSATGSAALTEDYAADGATFTLNQAIYMIWSLLAERAVVATTLTSYKLNGSTSAMTFTLDSATTPTTQTRAT